MGEYIKYIFNKQQEYECITMKKTFDKPKISIIIPCYNVEKYLEKCLDSVIRQTLKETEIICINDGSTDYTADILGAFSNVDHRIKVITQKNFGPSKARNEGLKIAKGEYITFIDADDWIDTNHLEKLLDAIERNHCDIAVSSTIRTRNLHQKYRVYYKQEQIYETLEDKIKICNLPKCCYVWNKLYKAELIKNSYFKDGVFYEDMIWLPDVLKKSQKLVTVPNCNYYYFANKNSIVKKLPSNKKQNDLYQAKKYIIKFFEENNLFLPNKDKNITKRVYYISIIPILKIKQYNKYLTYHLFGFLPIFKKYTEES